MALATDPIPLLSPSDAAPADRLAGLVDLSLRVRGAMSVARALIEGGRALDLTGVDDGVGMLCAQVLDLPRDQARTMLPHLHEVLAQTDALSAAIRTGARR